MMDVVCRYVSSLRQRIDDLTAAVEGGDLTSATVIAHGLHGSGGGFGFQIISDFGETIESLIDRGAARPQITQEVDALRGCVARIERTYPDVDPG